MARGGCPVAAGRSFRRKMYVHQCFSVSYVCSVRWSRLSTSACSFFCPVPACVLQVIQSLLMPATSFKDSECSDFQVSV